MYHILFIQFQFKIMIVEDVLTFISSICGGKVKIVIRKKDGEKDFIICATILPDDKH